MSLLSCSMPSTSLRVAPALSAPRAGRALATGRRQLVVTAAAASVKAKGAPPGLRNLDWEGTPEQVAALEELRAAMGGRSNDEEMQWFLRDRKFDVAATKKKLTAMLDWRQDFGVDSITAETVAAEAATGKAALHDKLDAAGRPVILVNAAKHVTGAVPLVESNRLCIHIIEGAMDKIEGDETEEDTILGIFDMRGYRSKNGDLGFVRFLVDVFFTYYPKRLSQVLLVEPPFVFQAGWGLIKPWLKKYSALVTTCKAHEVERYFAKPEDMPAQYRQ